MPTAPAARQECQLRVVAFLHHAWLRIEEGRVGLQPDPFYKRNALLTPEVVASVINYLEGMFAAELVKYRNYHNARNEVQPGEVLVTPGFAKQTPAVQRALVQGIDRIFQEYREEEPKE